MTKRQTPVEIPTGTRSIDLSVEVPGTVDEVWDTIATGPGISSWFVPHVLEERAGGSYSVDFGEDFGEFPGEVAVYDAPERIVMVSGDGNHTLAYEWLVEARDGGTCVVRLVNSGFGDGAEWDGEFDGMSRGWPIFLHHLRCQLTHFRGRRARTIIPTTATAGPNADAWARLCTALGVRTDLQAGDRFEATGEGVPPLSGRVDSVLDGPQVREYLLVLDEPCEGTAFVLVEGEGEEVSTSLYLYLYGPDAPTTADRWSPWFRSTMALPG